MFGTGKIFSRAEVPCEELALRYVDPKNFQFPEEYLAEYVKTVARLERALEKESAKVYEESRL